MSDPVYATPEDFLAVYGAGATARLLNIPEPEDPSDLLGNAQLLAALDGANGEAATHVRFRYRADLSSVPAALRRKTVDLARWLIVSALRPEVATELDGQVRDGALDWFRDLREGRLQLPVTPADERPKPGDPSVVDVGENVRYDDEPALHRHSAFERY